MTKWAIHRHQNPEGYVFDPRYPVIVRAELVEEQLFLSALPTEERCFDKLSTNGLGTIPIYRTPL